MAIEALPPFIILTGCVTLTGFLMKKVHEWTNEGKVRTSKFPYMVERKES
jgi:hypothetical protein